MKKIISLLLALCLLLSACGTKVPESEKNTTSAPETGASQSAASMAESSSAPAETTGEETSASAAESLPPTEKTQVNFGLLAGPTGMGAAKLLSENEASASLNAYACTLFNAPTDVAPKLISGELDIAAVPTNLAAVLYQKTNGAVKLLALNTLGVLYLLTADGESVTSVEDLKGKTVYSSGQGAVPEYVLNYILDAYDLKDEVNVVYEAEHDAVIAALASGKAKIAVLPEPKVTAALNKIQGLTPALDLTQEWNKAVEKRGQAGCTLSMGCVVVRNAFAEEHPEAVTAFLKEYEASITYMNDPANADEAAVLCEHFSIIPNAAVAKKALPGSQLCFVAGEDMKTQIAPFYQILFDYNPAAVGGKLPDDAFYFAK